MEGQEGRIFTLIPPIGSVLLNEQARFDQVSVCWPQRAPEENLYLSIFRGEVTSVSLTSYWNLSGQEEARREMVCIFWDLLCQIKSEINSSHGGGQREWTQEQLCQAETWDELCWARTGTQHTVPRRQGLSGPWPCHLQVWIWLVRHLGSPQNQDGIGPRLLHGSSPSVSSCYLSLGVSW